MFLLVALPRTFYLWSGNRVNSPGSEPNLEIEPDVATQRRFSALLQGHSSGSLEHAVAEWLRAALQAQAFDEWGADLNLRAQLKNAEVVVGAER
jgi:hypothetical protein